MRVAAQRLAGRQEGEQLEGEGVETRRQHPVAAGEPVEADDRRQGHGQAQAGHDQRLTHGASHLVQRAGAAQTDVDQGMVHTPDGAEQAEEGRGGAHGGQHRQAVLQAHGLLVQHLLDGAGQQVGCGASVRHAVGRRRAGIVLDGLQGVGGDARERVMHAMGGDVLGHGLHGRGFPEHLQEALGARAADEMGDALDEDQRPGHHGHAQQDDQQRLADKVALRQEVGEAEGGGIVHVQFSSSKTIGIST